MNFHDIKFVMEHFSGLASSEINQVLGMTVNTNRKNNVDFKVVFAYLKKHLPKYRFVAHNDNILVHNKRTYVTVLKVVKDRIRIFSHCECELVIGEECNHDLLVSIADPKCIKKLSRILEKLQRIVELEKKTEAQIQKLRKNL